MNWTAEQERVLRSLAEWIEDPSGKQVTYLAGYAGSGKTTLIVELGREAGAIFTSFTAKACLVMAQKGCPTPQTLHSLLYRPSEFRDPETGKRSLEFVRREDSPIADAPLVVVDEASMVDGQLAADLLSYGVKVLAVGDPAQLPPTSSTGGYFTKRTPDHLLTHVHRHQNGILRLATDVREGRGYSTTPGHYGDDVQVLRLGDLGPDEFAALDQDSDQIIVGTNARRHAMNSLCRGIRGFTSSLPARLDKVVCLRNDHQRGLQNGSLYQVRATGRSGAGWVQLTVRSDDGNGPDLDLVCHDHDFLAREDVLEKMPWSEQKLRQRMGYGWSITGHKSQGSQWDRVLVVDESRVFRSDAARWGYTVFTRAAERLVIVMP